MDEVILTTDGACSGNPGPGGWAYVLRHPATGTCRKKSGGSGRTTNNRMEMQAVLHGLAAVKRPCRVTVVTDSQYVAKGAAEWLEDWKARGWRTAGKKRVKNADLWRRLDDLLATHDVRFQYVAGHAGHAENEECDRLAVAAAQKARADRSPPDLDPDA
jgi:ribonuclease HI